MNKNNFKANKHSKKYVNKRALIVLILFMTFFSFGSICGIFSCANQCSKSTEVHAADFSGSNTSLIEMPIVLNGSFDFTTTSPTSYIYTDAGFVYPFVLRIGEPRAVGDDYVLFQIGSYTEGSTTPRYSSRAALKSAYNEGLITLHWFDVRYYSANGRISCNGTTIMSVANSYTSTADYTANNIDRSNYFASVAYEFTEEVTSDFVLPIGQRFLGYEVSLEDSANSSYMNNSLRFTVYFDSVEITFNFDFRFVANTSIEEYMFVSNAMPYSISYAVPEVDLSALNREQFNKGKEAGYRNGYDVGYREGKIDGYSEGVANQDYTFGSLFNGVVYAPFKAVVSLFNFDLLGVNMLDFVTSVLTVLAMFGLARLFI